MVTREDDINEEIARDTRRNRQIPGLILRCYHILWTAWVKNQWASAAPISVLTFEAIWDHMDLNKLWQLSFPTCYDHGTACGTGAAAIEAQDWGKGKTSNLNAIVTATIYRATGNSWGTLCNCNSAAATHNVAIASTSTTDIRVRFGGNPSLSPRGYMTRAHTPDVRRKAGRAQFDAIKSEALGRVRVTKPLGLPNAVAHNCGYDKAQWG